MFGHQIARLAVQCMHRPHAQAATRATSERHSWPRASYAAATDGSDRIRALVDSYRACASSIKESLIAPHGTRQAERLPTNGVTAAIHHGRPRLQAQAGHAASTALGSVWGWLVSRSVTV